jgi:hypothetical protein
VRFRFAEDRVDKGEKMDLYKKKYVLYVNLTKARLSEKSSLGMGKLINFSIN